MHKQDFVMLKVRKKAKFDLNLWFDISPTTTARASKLCVVLLIELSNISSRFGVWTTNGVKMPKVTLKIKLDLNSWAYLSQTTITRASKFDVVLWLELTNICPVSCLSYTWFRNVQS